MHVELNRSCYSITVPPIHGLSRLCFFAISHSLGSVREILAIQLPRGSFSTRGELGTERLLRIHRE